MRWLALLLALVAGQVRGEALCVVPLAGGGPITELEREDPRRIAWDATVIPGYPWLIVKPQSRYPLYTVRGLRFEELGADYPATDLSQYKFFAQRRDGSVIGFGANPRQLWLLEPGAREFRPVPGLRDYMLSRYDPEQDRIYQLLRDGRLYEVANGRQRLSELNGLSYSNRDGLDLGGDTALPRYVPVLGGYLAASDGQIWFHPERGGMWEPLDFGEPVALGWRLPEAPVLVDSGGRVILDMPMQVFVLDASGAVPRLLYSVATRRRPVMAGGRAIVWRVNGRSTWFERVILGNDSDEWLPDLVLLGPNGVEPVPGSPVRARNAEQEGLRLGQSDARNLPVPGRDQVIVEDDERNRYLWDGTRMVAMPQLAPSRIGRYVRFARLGDLDVFLSEQGFFSFDADFAVEKLPMPFEPSGLLSPVHSENFGGSFLVAPDGGGLWLTRDGRDYEPVENRTNAKILEVVADIPERRATLVSTGGGAALLLDCAQRR
ncbi:hypothetical protein [Defluviimonas salinarum]|uniref:WG containing repeat-containing protein n=1 Tax=Defluviimonas salinarum TaxID=2992147 RepID=A0ABT3J5N9_9RHOB|nr:hypothetical protein [Defluviimonas salinarum]MCW3782770.1 hypothetical protein [Defluviimonas salinarum]